MEGAVSREGEEAMKIALELLTLAVWSLWAGMRTARIIMVRAGWRKP